MDIQQIQDIVNLVANSQVAEVEIKVHGDIIRIKNRQQLRVLANDDQLASSKEIASLQTTHIQPPSDTTPIIKSKHIGRLKLSADAISEPLVKIGDKVQEGDTIAFVACMAQMLPITADQSGYVSDILLQDNTKVEYGTPIFQLKLWAQLDVGDS